MSTKPTQILSKSVPVNINGSKTRRVQSLDWNSNFTTEEVYELGNSSLVEESVSLVDTAITLNAFNNGSTDNLAQALGVYKQRNVLGIGECADAANSTGSIWVSNYGAGGSWVSSVSVNDWLEVIRANAHATTNAAEYVKVASIRLANAASLSTVIGLDATYNLSVAAATGDLVGLTNNYTINADSLDADPVHFTIPHRYSTSATTIMHTTLLPRAFIDNISYSFDTGGGADENMSFVGEEEIHTLNKFRESHVILGSFMEYTATGTVSFRVPLSSHAAFASPYAVYAGSNLVTVTTSDILHTSGEADVNANFATGLGVDSSTQIAYYYSTSIVSGVKGFKGLTNISNQIGKLTKGYIKIDLRNNGEGTLSALQRCTGISVGVPMGRTSIDELGESRSIAKALDSNLKQDLTLTFNRNDLKEYAKLINSDETFSTDLYEVLMTDLKAVKDIDIIVYLYNSQTTFDVTTLLRTDTFTNCNFTGQSSSTPISGAAGLDLTFSTEAPSIVGSGLPPTYS